MRAGTMNAGINCTARNSLVARAPRNRPSGDGQHDHGPERAGGVDAEQPERDAGGDAGLHLGDGEGEAVAEQQVERGQRYRHRHSREKNPGENRPFPIPWKKSRHLEALLCGVADPPASCSTSRSRTTCPSTAKRSATNASRPSAITGRSFTAAPPPCGSCEVYAGPVVPRFVHPPAGSRGRLGCVSGRPRL